MFGGALSNIGGGLVEDYVNLRKDYNDWRYGPEPANVPENNVLNHPSLQHLAGTGRPGEKQLGFSSQTAPEAIEMLTSGNHVDTSNFSPGLRSAWEALQGSWQGPPLTVSSGYRSPEHNAAVGGAKGSQHMHGNAVDVSTAGFNLLQKQDLVRQARAAGFNGVGAYSGGGLHFDTRQSPAVWGDDYTSGSAPGWLTGL